MIDLFDEVKQLATIKKQQNAKHMTQVLRFQNDEIIDNVIEPRGDTVIDIPGEGNDDLRSYVDDVYSIKQEIKKIYTVIDDIEVLRKKINLAITTEQENELSLLLNMQIKNGNNSIQSIKMEIKNVSKKFVPKSQQNKIIKKNIHDNLIHVFKKALHSYQRIQNDYNESMKDKMSRHIKIMYPQYTDEDISYVLNHDDINTQNLVKWKLQGHDNLKSALTHVESKYRDVRTLEKNVCDLHQTIIELSALIEMNDEVISNIHDNVNDAQYFTEKANVDLIDARNIQRSTSKWMFYISMAILIVVLIICLPVLVKFL
ncbi:syntaxin 1B/2/3 [Plasmodium inui San Antonio 1]|uniref:Syntaxin 1B/2/3 n=1 Tax=Plasmodium inui San Antonio 1 TaxID=1237626 RepID=W7A4X5_9APIC|nr:syntaxin 1B/2/3 [Plasmodium inui San Antonio 1]EUD66805.1 syntaxin 1B/2/3 [Plasmodium inui San Antonio 1]